MATKISKMIITRTWAMPNKQTFDIKPIKELIERHRIDGVTIDPFANKNRLASITNDLDPQYGCDFNLDAKDFLKQFEDSSVDMVYFDPPYSPRQVSECYKALGKTVNMETTQASFWSNMKDEIARIVKPGGIVLSFGWNSMGIGKTRRFEMVEVLLVPHGGAHNDTICVVERKLNQQNQ
jgi:hypothetical protein